MTVELYPGRNSHPSVEKTERGYRVDNREFLSGFDAHDYATRREGIHAWLASVPTWRDALNERQKLVVIAMLHNHNRTEPDWCGWHHQTYPALEIGRDRRALNADGIDVLHIQNRHNCVSVWDRPSTNAKETP